jgi:hypothetical protein
VLGVLLAVATLACRTPAALPADGFLGGAERRATIVPDALDHAAAELAMAALAADPDAVVRALGTLEVSERRLHGEGAPSGLVPAGLEAASAVLHRGREHRAAIETLLARDDLDDAARKRLERSLADDPLLLARERIGDARFVSFARFFNTLSEPIGRSVLNATLLPYTLGRAVAVYSLDLVEEEPLPLQRRQALAHWQTFRQRHPDAPEVDELTPEIEAYDAKRRETLHDRALARAEDALDDNLPDYALLYARRALRHEDSHAARRVLAEAEQRIDVRHTVLAHAQRFDAAVPVPADSGERALVLASLSGSPVADAPPGSDALSAERRFLDATDAGRAGKDDAMWETLETLADEGPEVPMARHAGGLLRDPDRHPYRAFERARSAERRRTAAWLLLGPLAYRPDADALGASRYLLDLPLRVQGALFLPIRLLLEWPARGPTPGDSQTAVYARRYLALHPGGEHAGAVRGWLFDFESDRENWVGALRVAETGGVTSDAELDALRERAAEQALRVASAEERRDLRAGLLTNVARTFPETRAGHDAGRLAREQAVERTTHEIRLSRGFLLENPAVAGPGGLDLAPVLLDEDPRNGELHPDGVALVGGRDVVVLALAESGDEDDPAERLPTRLSATQLSRLVAQLEETSFRNALLDEDDALVPHAQRDAVFERARLGLADDVDDRPEAEARYAYRGMRERYGMVRSREALLPVELVLQGSLSDLTLGAFPRLRPPRQTPDAVLYR